MGKAEVSKSMFEYEKQKHEDIMAEIAAMKDAGITMYHRGDYRAAAIEKAQRQKKEEGGKPDGKEKATSK